MVDLVVKEFGRIDYSVNAAGVGICCDISVASWRLSDIK